jgi:hypothetical protein
MWIVPDQPLTEDDFPTAACEDELPPNKPTQISASTQLKPHKPLGAAVKRAGL